ncbi:hypothetical protein D3C80_2055120 [compost metagenome]
MELVAVIPPRKNALTGSPLTLEKGKMLVLVESIAAVAAVVVAAVVEVVEVVLMVVDDVM